MFHFLKNKLKKIYEQVTCKINNIFSRTNLDENIFEELSTLLIEADTGIKTTKTIIANLKEKYGTINDGSDLKNALEQELLKIIETQKADLHSRVYLLVGINGSGKTTCAGKLAYQATQNGKRVLLVAADTFRAAAPEQLTQWANQTNANIVLGKQNQDPASVVFSGCQQFKNENYDLLIIDTAGRVQTKVNLMKELEKIKKVIEKNLPEEKICTLLTIDAMLGQNSFEQALLFHHSTKTDGIILTKMDGTGKGGIVFSIMQELGIPVAYLSHGEQQEHLSFFNGKEYINEFFLVKE